MEEKKETGERGEGNVKSTVGCADNDFRHFRSVFRSFNEFWVICSDKIGFLKVNF